MPSGVATTTPAFARSSPRPASIKRRSTITLPARTDSTRGVARAFRALTEGQITHAAEIKALSRENALAEFVRYQLRGLLQRDELTRPIRIFNWETVRPTAVFRELLSEEAAPFMGLATDIIGRFMPAADQRTLTLAAIWLVGQCGVFVRNRERLAVPSAFLSNWTKRPLSGWPSL